MFPTWNRTKWSNWYTTCSILVFQHTLDKLFCRIIQIYSKTLKLEENNTKQKITTEMCDGCHTCICSCYKWSPGDEAKQNLCMEGIFYFCLQQSIEPMIHRSSDPSKQPTNNLSNLPHINRTCEPTSQQSIKSSTHSLNQRTIDRTNDLSNLPHIHRTNESSIHQTMEPTIYQTFQASIDPTNHQTNYLSNFPRIHPVHQTNKPKIHWPSVHGNITSKPIINPNPHKL